MRERVDVDEPRNRCSRASCARSCLGRRRGRSRSRARRPATESALPLVVGQAASPARRRATNASTCSRVVQPVAQGLADQHGDGQRVALGVASSGRQSSTSVSRWPCLAAIARASWTRFGHRHRRQLDPAWQVAQPGLLVAAGGQQHLRLGLRMVRRNPASSCCSSALQADGCPAGTRRPVRRCPRSTAPAPARAPAAAPGAAAARPGLASGSRCFQRCSKTSPSWSSTRAKGDVVLERGEQHRPLDAAGLGIPAGELGRGGGLAAPA